MVPAAAAPTVSRRAVDLPGHDRMATRRAAGLEAALLDNDLRLIAALDPEDTRTVTVRVAGPTALIVAKLHKLHDRAGDARRLADKDAGDVYRLLQTTETALVRRNDADDPCRPLGEGVRALVARLSGRAVRRACTTRRGHGTRAMEPAVPGAQIEGVRAAFVRDVRVENLSSRMWT